MVAKKFAGCQHDMNDLTIKFVEDGPRRCGGCTLCCKLLPSPEINKAAGIRCPHQQTGKGCAIYARRPLACATWNCRWLGADDTADLRRPDRSRYVIDIMPDFITLVDNDTGQRTDIEVVQIWVDPKDPEAWRDPALLDYLNRRGEEGKAALIRWSNCDGMTVFPPSMSADHQWHEFRHGTLDQRTHTLAETVAAISKSQKVMLGSG